MYAVTKLIDLFPKRPISFTVYCCSLRWRYIARLVHSIHFRIGRFLNGQNDDKVMTK